MPGRPAELVPGVFEEREPGGRRAPLPQPPGTSSKYGLAALMSVATAAYSYTYGVVGVFALLVAGMCLWMCCECGSARQKDPA